MQSSSQATAEKSIRVRLAVMGKSQSWLAAQLGESTFWLSRRMTGATKLTTDDLDRIAEVFGTDVSGLLDLSRAVA